MRLTLRGGYHKSVLRYFKSELHYYKRNAGVLYWACQRGRETLLHEGHRKLELMNGEVETFIRKWNDLRSDTVSFGTMLPDETRWLHGLELALSDVECFEPYVVDMSFAVSFLLFHILLHDGYVEVDERYAQEGARESEEDKIYWD